MSTKTVHEELAELPEEQAELIRFRVKRRIMRRLMPFAAIPVVVITASAIWMGENPFLVLAITGGASAYIVWENRAYLF